MSLNPTGERSFKLMKSLAASSAFCITLVLFRIIKTGSFAYIFFIWNLFLAWVPLVAAVYLDSVTGRRRVFVEWMFFLLWLGFFPNAPYIMTDIVHLIPRPGIPFWFDALLVLVAAWNGLMIGLISLNAIQKFLARKFSARFSTLAIPLMLILCSFGIYLGRFERWNSWDVFTEPAGLLENIADILFHPFRNRQIFELVFLLSIFLFTSYSVMMNVIQVEKSR